MLSWWVRRREALRRAEDDATALITEHGTGAYIEARQRERDAIDADDATRWRRAALAIAKRTGRRVGLDTATRMASDADMSATPDVDKAPRPAQIDPLDELSATIARARRDQ